MAGFTSIQKEFLQKIEDLTPKDSSLVFELSELLEISTDSAYRRMRGETLLTIDEIVKLCNHYNVSFDAFSKAETNMVTFRYTNPEPVSGSFLEYLTKMHEDLIRINSHPEPRIVYAAEDIPVFFHYGYDNISAFKIFYWLKSIVNVPELSAAKYNPSLIDPAILEVSKNIFNLYSRIPSTEIWTGNTVMSTIKQIDYYWESGMFESKEDALAVCESLKDELNSIQKMAEHSRKTNGDTTTRENQPKNYELYYSDVEITNNCVLVEMNPMKAVYLGHFSFYTMSTVNESYCQKTSEWLNTIIKKSTLISGVSEKYRNRFFIRIFKAIEDLVLRINAAQ